MRFMFDTTNETFGRLTWNISETFSYGLAHGISYANILGVIFELSVIFFFFAMFWNKNSYFRSPYFVIYTIGCMVDVMPKFLTTMFMYVAKIWIFIYPGWGVRFYNEGFMYLWNLILAINRFTAIFFPMKYNSIWSKRNTTLICIFLCSYPILIHAFNYKFMYCQFTYLDCFKERRHVEYTDFELIFGYISDITYAILGTIFGSMAALAMFGRNKEGKSHPEKVLLAQSILSSVFLLGSTLTSWLASVNGMLLTDRTRSPEMTRALRLQIFFSTISQTLYATHHYLGLILLICMSTNFQNKYFEFYGIKWIMNRFSSKTKPADNVSVISDSSLKKTQVF